MKTLLERYCELMKKNLEKSGWFASSYLHAAMFDEWPLRCEMKPKPSARLADYLTE